MATLMKVANKYATREETTRAGRRPMPTTEQQEPANGDGSRGRHRNRNKDRNRKEEQDPELVAVTHGLGQVGGKKRRWENRSPTANTHV